MSAAAGAGPQRRSRQHGRGDDEESAGDHRHPGVPFRTRDRGVRDGGRGRRVRRPGARRRRRGCGGRFGWGRTAADGRRFRGRFPLRFRFRGGPYPSRRGHGSRRRLRRLGGGRRRGCGRCGRGRRRGLRGFRGPRARRSVQRRPRPYAPRRGVRLDGRPAAGGAARAHRRSGVSVTRTRGHPDSAVRIEAAAGDRRRLRHGREDAQDRGGGRGPTAESCRHMLRMRKPSAGLKRTVRQSPDALNFPAFTHGRPAHGPAAPGAALRSRR